MNNKLLVEQVDPLLADGEKISLAPPVPASRDQFIKNVYQQTSVFWQLLASLRLKILPTAQILQYLPEHGTLLDVGCGAGMLAFLIARKSPRLKITGFDRSVPAIEGARVALQSAVDTCALDLSTAQGIRFLLEDEFDQVFGDFKFNAVTMIDVIHHVPQEFQKSFWLKNAAKLEHGGIFIYKDMCEKPYWRALANRLHDLIMTRQWIRTVPVAQIKLWAKEAGLEVVDTAERSILWYGHEFVVMRKP